jgi:hypothetical protein
VAAIRVAARLSPIPSNAASSNASIFTLSSAIVAELTDAAGAWCERSERSLNVERASSLSSTAASSSPPLLLLLLSSSARLSLTRSLAERRDGMAAADDAESLAEMASALSCGGRVQRLSNDERHQQKAAK